MQRRTEKVNSNFRIFDVERKMQINFSFVSRSHHISNFVWFTFFSAASMSVFLLKSLMQFFVCTTATGLHLCVCQKLTFENILRINNDLTSWAIEGITQKSMLIYSILGLVFSISFQFSPHTKKEKHRFIADNYHKTAFFILATLPP